MHTYIRTCINPCVHANTHTHTHKLSYIHTNRLIFDIPWVRANRILNVLFLRYDIEENAKLLAYMRITATGSLLNLGGFLLVLLVYVHIMTCATMLVLCKHAENERE